MKVTCKCCNFQLTGDLYPTKKHSTEVVKDFFGEGMHDVRRHIPDGAFQLSKQQWSAAAKRLYTSSILVNPNDIDVQLQPQLELDANGCCRPNMTDLRCVCGTVVGEINIDCWQDPRVELHECATQRSYK